MSGKKDRPRVAVLFNAPTLPREHPEYASEAGVVAAARGVARALKEHGFKAWPLAAKPPLDRLVRRLRRQKPEVVFNLIEGFGGHSGGEAHITALLELMGLPYTGCPPEAQALCRHKGATKALLRGFGLPTAPFAVVGPGDPLPGDLWGGPVVVKPEAEDGSLGIDQGSVVADPARLAEQVGKVRAGHAGRVLIEKYLSGPEYNVGVVEIDGPVALPVAEVVYDVPEGQWPILTYAAKWAEGSAEDRASPVRCPAQVEPALADRLSDLALAAFRATGCRDVARVDFRLDESGMPNILEVNPNPDLDPSAGWARALNASGREYGETLAGLVRKVLSAEC
ncbi:MAG TPA: D-alanine--D-alanine ligase [Isosphaeraceae bacterium]|nr:D-alanine--D-alanine ligase [Isosphaeraceae bacterium]